MNSGMHIWKSHDRHYLCQAASLETRYGEAVKSAILQLEITRAGQRTRAGGFHLYGVTNSDLRS